MNEYIVYPDQVTEVVLGKVEIEGYECHKQCINLNGYIAQGERMTIYFDCKYEKEDDGCAYLEEFLRGEAFMGIKKKQGKKDDIISDLVEAIEDSDFSEIKVPFRIDKFQENMSPLNFEKFFSAFLGLETELQEVEDKRFVLVLKRMGQKKKRLENLRMSIRRFFLRKEPSKSE